MSLMTSEGRKLYVHFHPVTTFFLVGNAAMLLLVLYRGGFELDVLLELGAIYPPLIKAADQWYRLVSAMFLHGSLIHFLGNSLVLYYLGSHLERLLGGPKYFGLYMVSGIISSLTVVYLGAQNTITIGASGALFGVIGALLVLTFLKPTWFKGTAIRQIRQLVIINLVLTFAIPNISITGHIGGLVAGIVLIFLVVPKHPAFISKVNRLRESQIQ
ncbi:MAG: rhomboid family intramembrane serine protease [Acholeplasmataceae bacterium]|nr:rhomboid family intramembrane serine protease [Acholeplasmataceae bacterium]